jgi:site-specific DNA-methyltransferase (adenine-specific)
VVGDDQPFDPNPLLALGLPTVLWGANHYADRLPPSPSWFVWDKRIDLGSNDSADCEMAWTNIGGPARMFRHRWQGMLRDSERGDSYHPTQKPVALMLWVLCKIPVPKVRFVTLDPYMGGGATLVAAKSLGFKAVGIEIEERYCEIAANRCRQEVLGLTA